MADQKIAVLIPCLNEEATVTTVVRDFKTQLPEASIYVFDNGSEDRTAALAEEAGATVVTVSRRGKGNVVRAMFRKIDADIYVMMDGDATYLATDIHKLLEPIVNNQADMVVGDRISSSAYDKQNTRPFHSSGNKLVRSLINVLFGAQCSDILSGYRVFTRCFVENFPTISEGFEIETELTLHALDRKVEFVQIPIEYNERPTGSESKLNTFSDGFRIIKTIAMVFKNYRPLLFFGMLALVFALTGLVFGAFPVIEYLQEGYVHKVPKAMLAASLELLAMLSLVCGLVLDTSVRQHREMLELRMIDYLRRHPR
ncbi:MAG: glycosyltransferase [Gammaproteobacteria bacterium]|nr:glycosyltransferase [Gammaproteobacteria bacterium]